MQEFGFPSWPCLLPSSEPERFNGPHAPAVNSMARLPAPDPRPSTLPSVRQTTARPASFATSPAPPSSRPLPKNQILGRTWKKLNGETSGNPEVYERAFGLRHWLSSRALKTSAFNQFDPGSCPLLTSSPNSESNRRWMTALELSGETAHVSAPALGPRQIPSEPACSPIRTITDLPVGSLIMVCRLSRPRQRECAV